MSLFMARGGVPVVLREATNVTGRKYPLGDHRREPHTCFWMRIGSFSGDMRVFFRQEDFDNDEHYVLVASDLYWEGPVEAVNIWFKADAGTPTIEVTSFARRS